MVNYEEDYEKILNQNQGKKAVFMKFIEGRNLAMNAVRTNYYTILSDPAFQILGDPLCTNRRFGYCGNDFNIESRISEEEISGMVDIVNKVGDWVGELGFRGLFGIDFVSDGKNVYFAEINPRFTGSTSFLTDQQMEIGKIPLTLFHLVPYLDGITIDENFLSAYNQIKPEIRASQVLLHNTLGRDAILEYSLKPGRYLFQSGNIDYLGPGNFLSDTKSKDEIVVSCDLPLDGTIILNDSDEICRVYTHEPVLDKEGRAMNDYGKSLVNAVSNKLHFL
jgi:hypothetical protein